MQAEAIDSAIFKKQGKSILLCDTTGKVETCQTPRIKWVSSPIQCLHKAIEEKPALIGIRFGKISIKEREALIELCSAIRNNHHTSAIPIVALLNSKHRKLLEHLKQADVNYARYATEAEMYSFRLQEIMAKLRGVFIILCHLFNLHRAPRESGSKSWFREWA